MRRLVRACAFGGLAAAAVVSAAFASAATTPSRAGDLDQSFGRGGLVTTDLGGPGDGVVAVALGADGKIVVAGYEDHGNPFADRWVVARYTAPGSLDASFGGSGTVTVDFGTPSEQVFDVAVQQDGKIVVAGMAESGGSRGIGLVRYNVDGSLDSSFDGDGRVVTLGPGYSREFARALVIAPDGKIVVGGSKAAVPFPLNLNLLVARFNADGSRDTSFGTGGEIVTDFGTQEEVEAMTLDRSGKIVAVGSTFNFGPSPGFGHLMPLARYNADGSADSTFGNGGSVTIDFPGASGASPSAVAVQPDGKIVEAGYVGIGSARTALVRFNADGSPDGGFGDAGKIVTDSPKELGASGIAIDAHSRIITVGFASDGSSQVFGVARRTPQGTLDPTFGTGGIALTHFGATSSDQASDVVLQRDGKIVVAGESDGNVALARYLPAYCRVPMVSGMTVAAARAALLRASCSAGATTKTPSKTVPAGRVVRQKPAAGAQLAEGASVQLVVSSGRKR